MPRITILNLASANPSNRELVETDTKKASFDRQTSIVGHWHTAKNKAKNSKHLLKLVENTGLTASQFLEEQEQIEIIKQEKHNQEVEKLQNEHRQVIENLKDERGNAIVPSYYSAVSHFKTNLKAESSIYGPPIIKIYDLRHNPKYQCKENILRELDRLKQGLEAWQLSLRK